MAVLKPGELRGWAIWHQDEDDAALDLGEGMLTRAARATPDYIRPVWPAETGSQQMRLDVDFEVTDLEAEAARAVQLAAELPYPQPQKNVRVLLNPAGHPFCPYTG